MTQEEEAEENNLDESQLRYGGFVAHNEEHVEDDDAPVYNVYQDELGAPGVVTMIGLTPSEFDILWSAVEEELVYRWTHGRGRRLTVRAMDALFMTLCVLKHFNSWYKHAADFRLQPAGFERLVSKVIGIIEPVLFERYVRVSRMEGRRFENYPYALYATDVKFQQANRPSGSFSDAKTYIFPRNTACMGSSLSARCRRLDEQCL